MKPAIQLLALLLLAAGCGHTGRDLTPDVSKHVLDNGLEVYLLEDHSAPLFTFQYWVRVGSGDEWQGDPGITGLSHFFEHMMFRGTERYPSYFEEISKRGGQLNAFTWLDVTVFWEKLAATDLDFVLDIESDRLRNMTIDFLNLEPEREVVKSERLLRTENSPAGSLREAISATLFTDHSYHWPTVGWMRDLDAITIEQASEYHARYYAPNNAYIVLVGDFESARALELIQKRYGSLERRDVSRPARKPDAPLATERRTFVEKPTGTDLFVVSYGAPAGGSDDFVALEVAEQLLTGGKTSRLQKALVHGDDPVARSVGGFLFPFVDPSALMLDVRMLPGQAGRVGEERLTAEIARLIDEGVPELELERAVAQLRGSVVRGMSTTHSRAQTMGFAIRATGDPLLPWKRLKQYGEVTGADVKRVAAKYLQPSNRVIGHAVDPDALVGITAKFLDEFPSGVPDLDSLANDAVVHAASRDAAKRDAAAIAQEQRAIELLEGRAAQERKRLEGDAGALEKLEKYLKEGEKGPVKRRAKLESRVAALSKQQEALVTGQDALLKRHETLNTRVGSQPLRLAWIRGLIDGKGAVPRKPASGDSALGAWALAALSLQKYAGARPGGALEVLAAMAPKGGPLERIWSYAYAARRVDAGRM